MNIFQIQILAPLFFLAGMYLRISFIMFIAIFSLFLLIYKKLPYFWFRLCIFTILGLFRGIFIKHHNVENYSYKYTSFKAKITNIQMKDDKIFLTLTNFQYLDDYNSKFLFKLDSRALFPKEAKMELAVSLNEDLARIDEIEGVGRFYLPKPRVKFNLGKTMSKGIIKECNIIKYKKMSIKDKLKAKLYETMKNQDAALCSSIFFGDIFSVDYETKDLFSKTGVSYLLGPSILNLALILFFLYHFFYNILIYFFLRLSKYIPLKILAKLLSFISIFIYFLILGEDFPLLREFIMYNLFLLVSLYKKKNQLELLFHTAMITLCIFPAGITSISFQLTFGGVLGIFAFTEHYKNPILSSLKMTGSALSFVIPISIYHFHSIALQPYLASLLIMPLFSFLVIPLILVHLFIPESLCFTTTFLINKSFILIFFILNYIKNISFFIHFRPFSINYLLFFILFYILFSVIKERIRYLILLFGTSIFCIGVYRGYYFKPFILINGYNSLIFFRDKIIVYPKNNSMSQFLTDPYNLPCFDGKNSEFFEEKSDYLLILGKYKIIKKQIDNIKYDKFTYILTFNDLFDGFYIEI